MNEYSVGGDERLEISIEIANEGEDAYEANFFLDLPESINYIKTELKEATKDIIGGGSPSVLCSPPTLRNEHVLKCEMGNPMAANSKVNILPLWLHTTKQHISNLNFQSSRVASQVAFRILLQPTVNFLEDVSSFEMSLAVNSSNPDSFESAADNKLQFSLPVRVKTDLRIRG